jgi:glyoxylase-like metal-dependent hydrolase (beta-lactamase superfamily II)
MRRTIVLCVVLTAGALAIATADYQGDTSARREQRGIELRRVRNNLYLLSRGGGNTAVFVTELGVVIVDTKLAGRGQPMLDAIRTITPKPVTTIINTHSHSAHTGSNEFFGTAVQIVAHRNTRASMERMDAFSGGKVNFLPKLMFDTKMSLGTATDRIELHYFGPGHTNGDAWVVFPALRVLHAGDMFAARQLPLIDGRHGGSGLAYPDTLARAASVLGNVDVVITGHGDILRMTDLEDYARVVREFRDTAVDGFNRGLGVDEVVDRWTRRPLEKGYAATDPQRVRDNVEHIFGELVE